MKDKIKQTMSIDNRTIIITGSAGFIGANLAMRLLKMTDNAHVIGIDCMTDYNPISLKEYRLKEIVSVADNSKSTWEFYKTDIANAEEIEKIFDEHTPQIVVNLAAQGGIRYSIINPGAYIRSNLDGFYNILECCRRDPQIEHLIYASSSSVYGGRTVVPFKESDFVDNPVSLYAATKKSNELLAYSYSKLYDLPSTGLRFFTVYGPAGRTDMAYFSFAEKLRKGEKIDLFNYGNCQRDFTYIDDIITGVMSVMRRPPRKSVGDNGLSIPPYEIYNIGNSHPENLMEFVRILSDELIRVGILANDFDIEEHINLLPMQPGDVPITYADTSKLESDFGFKPQTSIREGLRRFAVWYKEYIC